MVQLPDSSFTKKNYKATAPFVLTGQGEWAGVCHINLVNYTNMWYSGITGIKDGNKEL